MRACFQNHPRTVARVAAEPESHQLDRKKSRARTGNEPDNDHTNTPTATQIGRLILLSFPSMNRLTLARIDTETPQFMTIEVTDR